MAFGGGDNGFAENYLAGQQMQEERARDLANQIAQQGAQQMEQQRLDLESRQADFNEQQAKDREAAQKRLADQQADQGAWEGRLTIYNLLGEASKGFMQAGPAVALARQMAGALQQRYPDKFKPGWLDTEAESMGYGHVMNAATGGQQPGQGAPQPQPGVTMPGGQPQQASAPPLAANPQAFLQPNGSAPPAGQPLFPGLSPMLAGGLTVPPTQQPPAAPPSAGVAAVPQGAAPLQPPAAPAAPVWGRGIEAMFPSADAWGARAQNQIDRNTRLANNAEALQDYRKAQLGMRQQQIDLQREAQKMRSPLVQAQVEALGQKTKDLDEQEPLVMALKKAALTHYGIMDQVEQSHVGLDRARVAREQGGQAIQAFNAVRGVEVAANQNVQKIEADIASRQKALEGMQAAANKLTDDDLKANAQLGIGSVQTEIAKLKGQLSQAQTAAGLATQERVHQQSSLHEMGILKGPTPTETAPSVPQPRAQSKTLTDAQRLHYLRAAGWRGGPLSPQLKSGAQMLAAKDGFTP